MKRFTVWQLAPDTEAYGEDAGKWLVVTRDGEREISGPMSEDDATEFAELLNIAGDNNALPDWAAA